jgi:transposase InsO family protein
MADHFQHQIRFWGIAPSYAFVGEPETNGVIERLFRMLKEQIIHGRVFQTIDELREAVRDFVARYNAEWLVEKNGYSAPSTPARRISTPTSGAPHSVTACPGNRVRYSDWTRHPG